MSYIITFFASLARSFDFNPVTLILGDTFTPIIHQEISPEDFVDLRDELETGILAAQRLLSNERLAEALAYAPVIGQKSTGKLLHDAAAALAGHEHVEEANAWMAETEEKARAEITRLADAKCDKFRREELSKVAFQQRLKTTAQMQREKAEWEKKELANVRAEIQVSADVKVSQESIRVRREVTERLEASYEERFEIRDEKRRRNLEAEYDAHITAHRLELNEKVEAAEMRANKQIWGWENMPAVVGRKRERYDDEDEDEEEVDDRPRKRSASVPVNLAY